ncbi:MAG: SGNH/GDSL hydrolase family protein [Candidatus Eremiobacteraeota bacterium]|nr:SGNH/GDSL hydrolase family protein [Candidatus Eremiobacteraeota bacterium]
MRKEHAAEGSEEKKLPDYGEAFRRPSRIIKLILLNIFIAAAFLGLMEWSTRQWHRENQIFIPDAYLMFAPRKNLAAFKVMTPMGSCTVSTNADGFRTWPGAPPVKASRPPGTCRIICLGDSVTFGNINISDKETYPYCLEKKLSEEKTVKPVEVMNGGCQGYTSLQGLEFYRRTAVKYKPDLLIIGFLNNDLSPCVEPDQAKLSSSEAGKFLKSLLYRSAFFRMLRVRIKGDSFLERYQGPDTAQMRVPCEDYRNAMEEFLSLASKEGTRVIFLNLPANISGLRFKEAEYREAVRDLAFSRKAGFIDLIAPFTYYQTYYHTTLFSDMVHPTKQGNEVMADYIGEFLIDRGYLTREGKK